MIWGKCVACMETGFGTLVTAEERESLLRK